MIIIQGKRGLIEIVEPELTPEEHEKFVRRYYLTLIECLLEIQKVERAGISKT